MSTAQGSVSQIIMQQETTYKQDPGTPATRKLHFVDESLRLSRNLLSTNIIRGNRNPAMPIRGNMEVAGTVRTHIQAYQFGTLLKWTLGSVVTTGSGPYTHTIKVGSTLPSFLMEKGFTDIGQYFKFNGCKINRMSLTFSYEGHLEASFDIMAAKETVSSTSFHTSPTDAGYVPFDGLAIAVIEEGGSSIAIVQNVDITVENNLDGSLFTIGSAGERVSLPEGAVKVSGNVKALFQNVTLYNKAKNLTESSLRLVCRRGTGAGTSGNEEIEFRIPELFYSTNAPVITGPPGVYVELPFEGFYDNSSEASAIQIVIKNMESTI